MILWASSFNLNSWSNVNFCSKYLHYWQLWSTNAIDQWATAAVLLAKYNQFELTGKWCKQLNSSTPMPHSCCVFSSSCDKSCCTLSIDNWVPHSGMLLYLLHRNSKLFFHPAKFDNFKDEKISDFKLAGLKTGGLVWLWAFFEGIFFCFGGQKKLLKI